MADETNLRDEQMAEALGWLSALHDEIVALRGDLRHTNELLAVRNANLEGLLGESGEPPAVLPRGAGGPPGPHDLRPGQDRPECLVHGNPMRRKKSQRTGNEYYDCTAKAQKGDVYANERGYCTIMAFVNDDGSVRYRGKIGDDGEFEDVS